MKINKLVALALLAFGFFESELGAWKKVKEEVVFENSIKDQPLEVRLQNNQTALHAWWDKSILSGHGLGYPDYFKDALKDKVLTFEQFKKMSENQLKEISKKLYANILRAFATSSEQGTPISKLKDALAMLSNPPSSRFDPVTYKQVLIKSDGDFEKSRHFSIEEYKELIKKVLKEHGSDGSDACEVGLMEERA